MLKDEEGGHYLFKNDWNRDEETGINWFINKQVIANQKSVLNFALKSIGKNLLSGKSVIGISLPVFIFDKMSHLERLA